MALASVTVTAFKARTRTPRMAASPSWVARSMTRKTDRLASQYVRNPSLTACAVSQLCSGDQSPSSTRSASSDACSTISSASTSMADSTFSKYW